MTTLVIIIGIVFVGSFLYVAWEIHNAPEGEELSGIGFVQKR